MIDAVGQSISNNLHCLLRNLARFICVAVVLAFISGSVVDIDHPIAWALGMPNGRFLMPYFNLVGYIAVGCGIIILISCLCRYSRIRLLNKKAQRRVMPTRNKVAADYLLGDHIKGFRMVRQERIFSIYENNKGLWCPFKPILFCQEGYCNECQIYLDWRRRGEMLVICAWCGKVTGTEPGTKFRRS